MVEMAFFLKGRFPLVRLATGTGKLSRGHAQFEIFAFAQENFHVRLFPEKSSHTDGKTQ